MLAIGSLSTAGYWHQVKNGMDPGSVHLQEPEIRDEIITDTYVAASSSYQSKLQSTNYNSPWRIAASTL